MTNRIEQLLSDYWDAAYAEGCDGRIHDTDKGDAQKALSGIRAEFRTLRQQVKQEQKEGATALVRFIACEGDKEPDPVERLRFFCSLAMDGQDWLDVEPFFDALKQQGEPVTFAHKGVMSDGFTMAVFEAEKVPTGTPLYTSAPTIPHEADEELALAESLIAKLSGSALLAGEKCHKDDRALLYKIACDALVAVAYARSLLSAAPKPKEPQDD